MPPADRSTQLAQGMLDFMQAMTRFLITEGRELDPELKITPPQFRVLSSLERTPRMSLNDIAAELGVRPATASVLVLRLIRQGLVVREPVPGRKLALSLSARGTKLLTEARRHILKELQRRMKPLSQSEQEAAQHSLQKLIEML